MNNNLYEAIEFLKQRMKNLKGLAEKDKVFYRGRCTAETAAITNSSSFILKAAERMIIIIQKTLVLYHIAEDNEPWMIKSEYATPAQIDTLIKAAEEKIIQALF